jgi:hypothetical protein
MVTPTPMASAADIAAQDALHWQTEVLSSLGVQQDQVSCSLGLVAVQAVHHITQSQAVLVGVCPQMDIS